MSKLSTILKVRLGFSFAMATIMLISIASYVALVDQQRTAERVSSTQETLKNLEILLSLVKDAETATRGFVLTGDERYLEPYNEIGNQLDSVMAQLSAAFTAQALADPGLPDLPAIVRSRMERAAVTIRTRRMDGFEPAAALVREGKGYVLMESLRDIADRLEAKEVQLLRTSAASAERSARRARVLIGFANVFALASVWLALVIIGRDFREKQGIQKSLEVAKEEAERASHAKSEFLANMSHELRTPLNSIIGFANVLIKKPQKRVGTGDVYLQRILENGKHLLELINSILDLSKIESGKVQLEVTDVSLPELLRAVIGQCEGTVRDKDVRLFLECPAVVGPVACDAMKLKQVIINLVSNGVKFTEHGSVTLRVKTQEPDARPVAIEVADTGIGIPVDRQAVIFEPFQQADNTVSRKFGGTGLGLTIARSLLQQMGFAIELVSEPRSGSVFRVLLQPPSIGGEAPRTLQEREDGSGRPA